MAPKQLLSGALRPIIMVSFYESYDQNEPVSWDKQRQGFPDCGNDGVQVCISMCSSRDLDIYVSLSLYSQLVIWSTWLQSAFFKLSHALCHILWMPKGNTMFLQYNNIFSVQFNVLAWAVIPLFCASKPLVKYLSFPLCFSFSCPFPSFQVQVPLKEQSCLLHWPVISWILVGSLMIFVAVLTDSCFPPARPPYPSPPLS